MRKYHDYRKWEDYKAGMFKPSKNVPQDIINAVKLLSDADELEAAMRRAVKEYPLAAEQNLSAADTNRRSWLGQSACFIAYGVVESDTRSAWWALTDSMRDRANAAADRVIADWESVNTDAETLFDL